MNEFVNYNLRGFELPPGCKDLIDLLRAKKGIPPAQTLTQFGEYLAWLLGSPPCIRSLWVDSLALSGTLALFYNGRALGVLMIFPKGREDSAREILRKADCLPARDKPLKGEHHFLYCLLPIDISVVEPLVWDLLLIGWGLPIDGQVRFRHAEKSP